MSWIRANLPFWSQEYNAAVSSDAAVVFVVADDEMLDAARLFSHHIRGEDEDSLVFSTGPLRIIQQIGVVLPELPKVIP